MADNNGNGKQINVLELVTNKKIKKIISLVVLSLQILFAVLLVFTGLKETLNNSAALYNVYDVTYHSSTEEIIFTSIVMGTALGLLAVSGVGILFAIVRRKMLKIEISAAVVSFMAIIFGAISKVVSVVFPILSLLISLLLVGYLIFYYKVNKAEALAEAQKAKEIEEEDDEVKNQRGGVIPAIVLIFVGLVAAFLVFLFPVTKFNDETLFKLSDVFSSSQVTSNFAFKNDLKISLIALIGFSVFFFAYMFLVLDASKALTYCKNSPQRFYKESRKNLYTAFAITILFFMFSVVIEYFLISQLEEGQSVETKNSSFIPLLIMGVVIIIQSILTGRYIKEDNKAVKAKKLNRLITFAFTLAFIGLLVGCVCSNIIVVEFEIVNATVDPVKVNGYEIFTNTEGVVAGHMQLFAFVVYTVFIIAIIALVVSAATFIRRSKYFYKASLIINVAAFVCIVALALFGKYYAIADEVNKKTIIELSEAVIPNLSSYEYTTTITSDCMIFMFAGLGLFGLLAVFRPYTKQIKEEGLDVNINDLDELGEALSAAGGGAGGGGGGVGLNREDVSEAKSKDFDSCPAFSEIDGEENEIKQDIQERRQHLFNNPSLPNLVRFVVDYARESRLHLSYKEEDIAQFVAGLGSSKLSILQGMSGTGKTSLPKIFAEAIMGNVNIIEVESSWKDKNELIGYFNEFSGKFTPKKFTQSLYRAAFYGDVITFIVLDEMNLSRIEYYFSDFLSLMENEPDKREIKLLNVQLKNFKGGVNLSYKQLKKGHTLKVSPNIWFIGTANRDESTFEISDKVYDRAMTMNFNKRAPKIDAYSEPIDQRFLDFNVFNELLEKAATAFNFDCSTNPTIKAVERLLAPYNISFGNRIERQIEKFVSVYCSCFTDSEKMIPVAVEKILFSKVVAKLEFKSVENKEELAHNFEELGLMECASFVNKLNGDL